MKSLKLVAMAMLCVAVSLVSCSGEDGEQGEQGKQGDPGADSTVPGPQGPAGDDGISCWDLNGNGIGDADEDINQDGNFDALDCQGEQGEQGEDGNANVEKLDFLITDFSGPNLTVNLGFSPEEMNSYVFLYYIEYINGFDNLWYPVPGPLITNATYSRVYTNENKAEVDVYFYNTSDDTLWDVPQGTFTIFRVVAIELSNAGKTSENVMAELKAAGVDTSDYNAVATYFGLE